MGGNWQIVCVLGGLYLVQFGAAIFYSMAYLRLRGQRFEGVIIGIRRREEIFHSVYQYPLPNGEVREATSNQGGAGLKGRTTGSRRAIYVMPDRPGEASEAAVPTQWALPLSLVVGGCWLTFYALTAWKPSAFTWIVFVVAAAYWGRKFLRWRALHKTNTRSQPGASDVWSALPIETAETVLPSPQTKRFQVKGSPSQGPDVIFCIIGLVILALTYIHAHKLLLLRAGARAQGTVLQLRSGRKSVFPKVQFTSTDGTIVRFENNEGWSPSPYRVGDHVTVLYQPGKLDTAMIDRGIFNWETVGLGLVLGMAFTTMGLVNPRALVLAQQTNQTRRCRQATKPSPRIKLHTARQGISKIDRSSEHIAAATQWANHSAVKDLPVAFLRSVGMSNSR